MPPRSAAAVARFPPRLRDLDMTRNYNHMRPRIHRLLLASSTALAFAAATGTTTAAAATSPAAASSAVAIEGAKEHELAAFDVPWHTIDDGGERISGGGFAAVVTIGQPEPPGKPIGGGFTLRGGYWPRLADPPTTFADGFESGTVDAWSSSTP